MDTSGVVSSTVAALAAAVLTFCVRQGTQRVDGGFRFPAGFTMTELPASLELGPGRERVSLGDRSRTAVVIYRLEHSFN